MESNPKKAVKLL